MNKVIEKSIKYEQRLASLLTNEGFKILKEEHKGGYRLRPDFIVEKDNKKYLIELKVQNIVSSRVLQQIVYYKSQYRVEQAYLAIPDISKINQKVQEHLLNSNIGIIRVHSKKLEFEKPKKEVKPTDEEIKEQEEFSEKFELKQAVEESKVEIKNFSKEFIIYIVFGGIFVYAISNILNFYFDENITAYWIIFIVCLILTLIYYNYIRIKR